MGRRRSSTRSDVSSSPVGTRHSSRTSGKKATYREDLEDDELNDEEQEQNGIKEETPMREEEEEEEEEEEGRGDDEDDDAPVLPGGRRARQGVNYAVDNSESEDEVLPKRSSNRNRNKRNQSNDESDAEFDGANNSRSRSKKRKIQSDESEFHDSDSDVSDEFLEKMKERAFVASEDEDGNADQDYITSRRRTGRGRQMKPTPVARTRRSRRGRQQEEGHESEEIDDTLQDELADLNDSSSPAATKHVPQLRERKQVNYEIPPPITNDSQLGFYDPPSTPKKRAVKKTNVNQFRKILFPTAGPFGGSDVISLFGKNIPPGSNSLGAIGDDSDSSEDEIRPVNGDNGKSNPKLITGGTSTNGKAKKSNLADSDPLGVDMNIDFSVVGGLDNYIDQLKEMVALPLLYPEIYQKFGITPPRGVLFHGPPGTGKTLMARALASACSTGNRKITFFMRKGADCLSKWVGEAERQLRLLFEEAKQQQPSIIFFDEIDGLAPVRSSKQEQIHASIVSTLLALMDGMDNRGQVIVIGATNRPDSVDPALRRPGRFDREFYFPLPDVKARSQILKIHTKKWVPSLSEDFVDKIAHLTKGYGGADLRALCTEAALNSIQRKYPQIYKTSEKLKIDPSKIFVVAKDFMKAVEKIVPSSARSTSSGSAPLPDHLVPLLSNTLKTITSNLDHLVPQKKKISTLEEAMYVDVTSNDKDGGFERQEILRKLESSRVYKPRLLISGDPGLGQQYLGSAILNHLEGFHIQSLDLGSLFEDSTRTPEATIVQRFIESRRHQPSIMFIPNIDIWYNVVPHAAKATLAGLLRSLNASERILLLGISEVSEADLDPEIKAVFGFSFVNNVHLESPNEQERTEFFKILRKALHMKPTEFNDIESRPKRKLKELKILKDGKVSDEQTERQKMKTVEYNDTKLKNTLKIKLAGLMDLFKNRYKRFKKPIIDELLLIHLFDPEILNNPNYELLYEKTDDNMVLELSTGRHFHNMDLEIVEERLWNGFYSEPKQFMKDIKQICQDAITSADRERILKANEMLTNAQFGIDDFSTPEFLKECKEMHQREIERQKRYLEEQNKYEELQNQQELAAVSQGAFKQPASNSELLNGSILNEPLAGPMSVTETTESLKTISNSNGHSLSTEIVVTEAINSSNMNPLDISNITNSADVNMLDVNEIVPEVTTAEISGTSQKQNNMKETHEANKEAQKSDESDSESEAEYELPLEEQLRQLVIDEAKSQVFFEQLLPELTEGYSIEKLEQVNAKFMDIIWRDRLKWDKESTLFGLSEAARWFSKHF